MAVETGSVNPWKLPSIVTVEDQFDIPGHLGFVTAIPEGAATYTLPSLSNIVSGAFLFVRNLSAFDITLEPADGETIDGGADYTVAAGTTVWIVTQGKEDWAILQSFSGGGSGVSVDGTPTAGTAAVFDSAQTIKSVPVAIGDDGTIEPDGTVGTVNKPLKMAYVEVTQDTNNTTPVTADGQALRITSAADYSTAAGAADTAFTVNNSVVTPSSVVIARVIGYTGTLSTNGLPDCIVTNVTNGSFDLQVINNHDSNALDGTITFGVLVLPSVAMP